jgi:hypothetical protein
VKVKVFAATAVIIVVSALLIAPSGTHSLGRFAWLVGWLVFFFFFCLLLVGLE